MQQSLCNYSTISVMLMSDRNINNNNSNNNRIMSKLNLSSAELRLKEACCVNELTMCTGSFREQCEALACQKHLFQHDTQVKGKVYFRFQQSYIAVKKKNRWNHKATVCFGFLNQTRKKCFRFHCIKCMTIVIYLYSGHKETAAILLNSSHKAH